MALRRIAKGLEILTDLFYFIFFLNSVKQTNVKNIILFCYSTLRQFSIEDPGCTPSGKNQTSPSQIQSSEADNQIDYDGKFGKKTVLLLDLFGLDLTPLSNRRNSAHYKITNFCTT